MNKFMQEAIKEAYRGIKLGHGGPFGAVIVKNGKIVAKDHNHVIENNDPTAHGEISVIRKACKKLKTFDLSGCELYTTGYPCPMCMAAAQWANIEKIYFGCNLKDTSDLGFRDDVFYRTKIAPIEIDRKSCLELYSDYNKIKNKVIY